MFINFYSILAVSNLSSILKCVLLLPSDCVYVRYCNAIISIIINKNNSPVKGANRPLRGGETSWWRNVLEANRPGGESSRGRTVQMAKRPRGETFRGRNVLGAKPPGGELTKGRNVQLPMQQFEITIIIIGQGILPYPFTMVYTEWRP